MNFKHLSNLQESIDGMKKIFSISWSPNLMRLAVAHVDEKRTVRISLFDEKGEKKESFPTRAANKSYVVRDISFSPDSTKLAVSQSDNIIFVYNLGPNWGDKKTICNKFEQNSQVTTMIWPSNKSNELFFGIAEGKVKVGLLKSNSAQILFSTESYVVSMCNSLDGRFIFSGHIDFSVYKYNIENGNCVKIFISETIPYCLSYGLNNSIFLAGNNSKIYFYSDSDERIQMFDYSYDDKIRDFTVSRSSTSCDYIAVGNFNKFWVFFFNSKKNQWEEVCNKYIENYYTVTALTWKPESLSIITGSLCGSIDIFESCLKKSIYANKFEITFLSQIQIVVKNLQTNKRMTLKSSLSSEIIKVNIQKDNYIVINANESLLIGDLLTQKWSEISWNTTGNERFDYNNPNICIINHSGELAIVEFGKNEILGYCRTEYMHPNLISAVINYKPKNTFNSDKSDKIVKLLAYLVDPFTINIQDLSLEGSINNIILTITHDSNIEFLDMNKNGNKLLYRDGKRHLYLYFILENRKIILLNYCNFVQWVPDTEVLVVQDRNNLLVWYNLDDVDNYKIINIKGDIEEVRRNHNENRTEVLVDEGGESKIYLLDESLISLSIALDENNLNKAVSILESLSHYHSEFDVYWKTLSKIALSNKNLLVAQRCFAAYGAYTKVNYIKKILKDVKIYGMNHPVVEAKILILDKQFINAENILIKNNLIEEVINIFNEIHRYEECLIIAEKYNLNNLNEISDKYLNWLLENEFYDKAAELKVKKGAYLDAIELYIRGDYFISATNLILREKLNVDKTIVELLINAMEDLKMFSKAGELCEFRRDYEKSISMYLNANCYSKAIEISRQIKMDPNYIKMIEEMWGTHLVSQMQIEQSIAHFLEAGRVEKAIDSLISLRKYDKAAEFCEKMNIETDININWELYFNQIGEHFIKEKNYNEAEKFFHKSMNVAKLIEIYSKTKNWEKLESHIDQFMNNKNRKEEIISKLISLATKSEKEGKLKDAERLYLYTNDPNLAITMYKNYKRYDEMIKIVETYLPDNLVESCMIVAKINESESNLKEAEKFLTYCGEWKAAVEMYVRHKKLDECIRIAEKYAQNKEELLKIISNLFKPDTTNAKNWLISLEKYDICTRYLCNTKQFEEALIISQRYCKDMLPFVYLRYALEMKDAKNYSKAEELFLAGKHPKDAVDMYMAINDYNNALRITRNYCDKYISDVYLNQGNHCIKNNDLEKAEICFVKANKPELIYNIYLDKKLIEKAYSFAEKYSPELLKQIPINDEFKLEQIISKCTRLEKEGNHIEAIEILIQLIPNNSDKNQINLLHHKIIALVTNLNNENRYKIYDVLARKYLRIDEYKLAGDILIKMENYQEAIQCYVMSNDIREAQEIIQNLEDTEKKECLMNFLNKNIQSYDPNSYEKLLEEQKYEECLLKLKRFNSEQFNNYFIKISSIHFINRDYLQLTSLILNIDPVFDLKTIPIVKALASEILAEENFEELMNLKNIFELIEENSLEIIEKDDELKKLHLITYYQLQKNTLKNYEEKLPEIYYNLCISILKYGDLIKMDVAMYDAMRISEKLKSQGNAFIFANRYLDIYDSIASGSPLEIDSELKLLEIPQENLYLSQSNIISAEERENLSKWILDMAIDKSFEKKLNMCKCIKCNSENFESNLNCAYCGNIYEKCIISGFPIRENYYSCKECNKNAIEFIWKEWKTVFDFCPWCKSNYN